MGPRLVSRGKLPNTRSYGRAKRLQWGRDLLVAERRKVDLALGDILGASMGPRLVSRGKHKLDHCIACFWVRFNGAATC